MKKFLAVLLAVMTLVGVFGMMASAKQPGPNRYCTCEEDNCPVCTFNGCRVGAQMICDCANNTYVQPDPGTGFANAVAKFFLSIDSLFAKLGFFDVEGYGRSGFFDMLNNLFAQLFGYNLPPVDQPIVVDP